MTLEFKPTDALVFQRPLIHTNKEVILLKNPNSEAVIFRVKTTAPKQYCVRPISGRLDSLGQIEIEVILMPFKAEPPAYFECKDKFLIQSAQIQRHQYEGTPASEIWHIIGTQNLTAVHHHRIKCLFSSDLLKSTMNHLKTTQGEPSTRTNMIKSTSSSLQFNELDPSTTTTTPRHFSPRDEPLQLPISALSSADETDSGSSSVTHQVPLTSMSDLDNSFTCNSSISTSTSTSTHRQQYPTTPSQHLASRLSPFHAVKEIPSMVLIFMCVAISYTYFFF